MTKRFDFFLLIAIAVIFVTTKAISNPENANYKHDKVNKTYADTQLPIRYLGTVKGTNGEPIPNAEISFKIYFKDGACDTIIKTDNSGKFDIIYKSYGQNLAIKLGAPSRNSTNFQLATAYYRNDCNLEIILGGYPKLKEDYIIGINILDNNGTIIKTDKFKRLNKTQHSVIIESDLDTIRYQVTEFGGNTRNGTMQDFTYNDGSGDFISCILNKNKGGKTEIILDESLLPDYGHNSKIIYNDEMWKEINFATQASTYLDQMRMLHTVADRYIDSTERQRKYDSVVTYLKNYQFKSKIKGVEEEFKSNIEYLISWLNGSLYFSELPIKSTYFDVNYFADSVSTKSLLWTYKKVMIQNYAFALDSIKRLEFLEALTHNDDPEVVAKALQARINFTIYNDKEKAQKDIDLVLTKYKGTQGWKEVFFEHSNEKPIKIGKRLKDFKFYKYNDSLETNFVTLDSLKGKYVLIDFWATWCAPCVAELPFLTKAFDELKDKNFTILSISVDQFLPSAIKFRKGKYSMPWINVYAEGHRQNEYYKSLGIQGIPYTFLIDPNGVIINEGNGGALRGEGLLETLKKEMGL